MKNKEKEMKTLVKNIGVDAGMIMVGDMDYLKNIKHNLKELKRLGATIIVPIGEYIVSWSIAKTWRGAIKGKNFINITSGNLFVCDPCYIIGTKDHADWMDWFKATSYGNCLQSYSAFIINKMGGDGCYDVKLNFELINKPEVLIADKFNR